MAAAPLISASARLQVGARSRVLEVVVDEAFELGDRDDGAPLNREPEGHAAIGEALRVAGICEGWTVRARRVR